MTKVVLTEIYLFFLLACLLLSLTCSCGPVKSLVQVDNVLEDALLPSNIEKLGTDCVVKPYPKISYEKLNGPFTVRSNTKITNQCSPLFFYIHKGPDYTIKEGICQSIKGCSFCH